MEFIAVARPDVDGGFVITVPGMPGCMWPAASRLTPDTEGTRRDY